MNINTTAQLITEAAMALSSQNSDRINQLHEVNNSWLQTTEEHDAITTMLDSMLDAIDEIENS
jgi:hypothetical protein